MAVRGPTVPCIIADGAELAATIATRTTLPPWAWLTLVISRPPMGGRSSRIAPIFSKVKSHPLRHAIIRPCVVLTPQSYYNYVAIACLTSIRHDLDCALQLT